MGRQAPSILVVLVVAILGGVLRGAGAGDVAPPRGPTVSGDAFYALSEEDAKAGDRKLLGDDLRAGGLRFAPDVDAASRAVVLGSVARARPEAARLIALVDGLVDVRVGDAGHDALGTTTDHGGRYDVVLDIARVQAQLGERGVDRLVLHELGHVLDGAVVGAALDDALDAQMPPGYACAPGERTSACAPREERFAETFAKWATGDIGVNLNIGYAVAPPVVPLDRWGEPLAALGEDQGQ